MSKIIVYSKNICPYCVKAKALLDAKKLQYDVINLDDFGPEKKDEMIKKANGKKTVPQIFIGSTHVGGCDDLFELHNQKKLDALLESEGIV